MSELKKYDTISEKLPDLGRLVIVRRYTPALDEQASYLTEFIAHREEATEYEKKDGIFYHKWVRHRSPSSDFEWGERVICKDDQWKYLME